MMNEILQLAGLLTGLFGIGLTLNGTYNLFKQITGLREINPLEESEQKELEKDDLYRDLVKRINDEIKNSNKLNENNHKHVKRIWMRQIVWGSIISALSLIFSYATSKICDQSENPNEPKCEYYYKYH